MAIGAAWKGQLKISLVSIPVRGVSAATTGGGKISFNQLHAKCHSRIRYQKVCPIHGEIPNSEIVSGYEYAKDQYVVVDPDEIDKLRTESDSNLDVRAFVDVDELDPIYYSGKSYYLLPEGKGSDKPYQLIRQAMKSKKVCAIGQFVLSKREELMAVRAVDDLLVATALLYASQIKSASEIEFEPAKVHGSKPEVELTNQLIDSLTTDELALAEFHDDYTEKLKQLIDAKVEGREIVAAQPVREPEVINLMDALKKSLKRGSGNPAEKSSKRLPGIKAMRQASAARRTPRSKRKSG